MQPGRYDLSLYRGDTAALRFVLWEDTGHTVPYDISTATAASEIRDKSGGAVITALTCTVTAPNIIDVVLDAAASPSVVAKGVWDLQLTWPDGTVRTVIAGNVTTTADVTDSVAAPVTVAAAARQALKSA